jgi:hypothetical protein
MRLFECVTENVFVHSRGGVQKGLLVYQTGKEGMDRSRSGYHAIKTSKVVRTKDSGRKLRQENVEPPKSRIGIP